MREHFKMSYDSTRLDFLFFFFFPFLLVSFILTFLKLLLQSLAKAAEKKKQKKEIRILFFCRRLKISYIFIFYSVDQFKISYCMESGMLYVWMVELVVG